MSIFGDRACEVIKVKRSHMGGINRANALIRKGRHTSSSLSGIQERPCEHTVRRLPAASQDESSHQESNKQVP